MPSEHLQAYVSQKGWWIFVTAVTLALLLVIGGGVWLGTEVLSLSRDNRRAIARLNRLANPTPEQFSEDLARGVKRCLRDAECRRLFPAVVPRRPATGKTTRTGPTQAVPRSSGVRTTTRGGTSPPRARINRPPRRQPKRGGAPASGGSATGSPTPPPSSPPAGPPVSLTAPLPVTVCTNVLTVNC